MAEKVQNKKIRGIWKWELLHALVIYGGPYLQTQQTILETQHNIFETRINICETQTKIIETQHKIIETQHKIVETQHKIIKTQHNIIETEHKVVKTQHKIIETQHKILAGRSGKPRYESMKTRPVSNMAITHGKKTRTWKRRPKGSGMFISNDPIHLAR